ncbi:MAG: ABC transporter permease [Acidobacteriota bacterium]
MPRVARSRELILLLILAALVFGFSVSVDGFLDWMSLAARSRYWVATGMIAVSMTFVIATAGIDLSVGSILALSGVILGVLYRDAGWPIFFAALGAVLAGGLAGAFNGWLSSYLKIPALVVTLATMALFSGIAMGLSQARPIGNLPRSFQWIGQGDLFRVHLSPAHSISVPFPILVLVLTAAVGWILLRRSWIGRFAECIGESEMAAQFAAIDVRRTKLAIYAASGLVAGMASLVYTALFATARPDAGKGIELEVIACVVLGGTRIGGGSATVMGSLIGLLIVGIMRYGLEMAGMKSEFLIISMAGVLILSAVLNEQLSSWSVR